MKYYKSKENKQNIIIQLLKNKMSDKLELFFDKAFVSSTIYRGYIFYEKEKGEKESLLIYTKK